MAHWAELDENNIVLRVLVTDNNDPNGDEGYKWLLDNLGGRWVQTSYNNNFRNIYAPVGGVYNEELDVFLPPKPFGSWILDKNSLTWVPPVPKPESEGMWQWDESSMSWVD